MKKDAIDSNSTSEPRLPIDVPIPYATPLEDGAICLKLINLDEVVTAWAQHRHALPYVAAGLYAPEATFLHPWDWIFAPTKASAVRWAMRWHECGVAPVWERDDFHPDSPGCWSWSLTRLSERDRTDYFRLCSQHGTYLQNFRNGCWMVNHLPAGESIEEWLVGDGVDHDAFYNPALSPSSVQTLLQDRMFDNLQHMNWDTPFVLYDEAEMDSTIDWQQKSRNAGFLDDVFSPH